MSDDRIVSQYQVFGERAETEQELTRIGIKARVTEVRLSDSRAEGTEVSVSVNSDDVVAVELDDGFTLWMSGERPAARAGGGGARR